MQNSDFLAALGGSLDDDEYLWVCAFAASPDHGEWGGRYYRAKANQALLIDGAGAQNTYFCPAVLEGMDEHGAFRRGKRYFKRLAALGADDADPADVMGRLSWVVETSPGKRQMGILLDQEDPDTANLPLVDAVMQALADAGLIKADKSGNNAVRYMRLPVGTNTKDRPTGPFQHRLEQCDLSARYSLEDACAAFGLDLAAIREGLVHTPEQPPPPTGTDHASLIAALSADVGERSYHDPLLKLSAKLVKAGLQGGAVVEHLRGLMLAVRPKGDPAQLDRWQGRYDEIPRLVTGAEQYRQPHVEIALGQQSQDKLLLDLAELERISGSIRWQVKGLVPADSMGMLFGASGAFKSFLALDLALHVANGMRWCDRITTPGSVVYVAAEGGAGIYRRVAAWHKKRNIQQTEKFRVCITPLLLTLEDQVLRLADAIRALPERPELVVIDTLSQTFSGDENAATDVADYIRLINTHIRAAFGCTVTILHHTGHAASERPRGSSALTANLDFLLGCFRPDADALEAQLEVIKQKDGDKIDAQHFELVREVLGKDSDGEEVSSLVAEYHNLVQTLKKASQNLTDQQQAVLDIMSPEESTTADQIIQVLAGLTNETAAKRNLSRVIDRLRELRLIKVVGNKRWRRV
jgi:hypothetical protein